jgi:hypothetical protein
MVGLTDEQSGQWERDGFFIVRGFAEPDLLAAMESRVLELAEQARSGEGILPAYLVWEEPPDPAAGTEGRISKLFRVHREEPVFLAFAEGDDLLDLVGGLIGPGLDCFLSQFIFKLPGALGQPWHQDSFYFPFDRGPQVGVWLAVTEAHEQNGPLWVLPGSHREPVHDVVPDQRKDLPAHSAYVEIVDHDMSDEVCVLMEPGDLLAFHSHLMHRSTDNVSEHKRAAMVFHYATAGTVDQSQERWGFTPPNIDWMPVRRT